MKKKKNVGAYEKGQARAAFWFCLPILILSIIFFVIPFGMSVVFSFTNRQLIPKAGVKTSIIGLDNYVKIFTTSTTILSFRNTFLYALIVVPVTLVLSTLLAVLVNKKIRYISVFRLIYFSPQVVTMTVVCIVWAFIFSPNSTGLMNSVLGLFGIEAQRWLRDKNLALLCIAIMYIWQTLGLQMLIILGGLQYIPHDLYEAASLDGCSSWKSFLYITIPGLKNTLVYVFVSVLIASLKVFTQVYVLTNGGPSNATTTVVYQLYNAGFVNGQLGYSSAISVTFFLVVMIISLLQNKLIEGDD